MTPHERTLKDLSLFPGDGTWYHPGLIIVYHK
jgi:hypothetical protein